MPYRRSFRLLRHMTTDLRSVNRSFPAAVLAPIEQAITAGERVHRGQVCFAVEGSLPPLRVLRKLTPRERALEVFGLLRVWDTEENAGVLIYLLLADRDVEIVADRGIDRRVDTAAWQAICTRMETLFPAHRLRRERDPRLSGRALIHRGNRIACTRAAERLAAAVVAHRRRAVPSRLRSHRTKVSCEGRFCHSRNFRPFQRSGLSMPIRCKESNSRWFAR